MANNDVALRRWVLRFLSLGAEDQQSIKSGLSEAENQQLNTLLEQAEALGLAKDRSIIEDLLAVDPGPYDRYGSIVKAIVEHMPPAWYALLNEKLLSDEALAKQGAYYEQYCLYKKKVANHQLAPQMQAALQTYFQEKVIHARNK